jgi:hypothetical protein
MPYAILDLSNKRQEAYLIAACVALAMAFCYLVPAYGYLPVLFISPFLYMLSLVARAAYAVFRMRRLAEQQRTPKRR